MRTELKQLKQFREDDEAVCDCESSSSDVKIWNLKNLKDRKLQPQNHVLLSGKL